MKPFSKSKFTSFFCPLMLFSIVRPMLKINIQLLENKFVDAYREGGMILYVSSYNKNENTIDIQDPDTWGVHWQSFNILFKEILMKNKYYERFYNKLCLER